MAVKTYMKPTLRRIARIVTSYAVEQKFGRAEFSLVGSWDEKTDRISLILGTTHCVNATVWYADIMTRLRSSFAQIGDPYAAWHVGLVIRSMEDEDQLYSNFRVNDDEEDVTETLETTIDAAWAERKPPAAAASDPD